MSGTTTKPRGNARPTHLPSRTPSRCGRAFSGENHRKCGLALLVVCAVLDIGTGSQLHGHGPDKIQPSPRIPNLCRWRKLEATQPPASRVPVSHISGHASVTGPYSRPRDASLPAAGVTERGSAAEALRLEPSSQPPYPLFSLSLSLPPPRRRPLSRRCRLSHHGRHTVHPAAQPTRTTERTCVESATPSTSHVATRILQPYPCSWQPSHCCQCAPASRSNRPGRENARRLRQAKSQGRPQAINPATRQPPQTTSNRRSDGQGPTGGEIGNYCVSCPLTFFPSTRARVRTGCRAFPVFLLSPNTRLTRSSSHPLSSAISPIMQLTSRLAAADPARAQRLALKTGARGRRNAISLNGAPTGKVIELWKEWVTRRWNPEAKFLNLEVCFIPGAANWF